MKENEQDYNLISALASELIHIGCTYFQKNKTPLGEEKIKEITRKLVVKLWGEKEETTEKEIELICNALTAKELKDFYRLIKHK